MPKRIKEKVWDIGSGKHPTHIVNTEFEPVEISLEMMHQDARFLGLVTGACSTAGEQKVVQVITPGTWTQANVDGAYFLFYVMGADPFNQKCYAVYMDVDSDQGGAPGITGATDLNIDFASADNLTGVAVTTIATLLDEMELALEAATEITAITTTDTILTTTTVVTEGAVCPPRNGASSPVFTFSVTTAGASDHTITEALTSTVPRFGLHIEYNNGSEDIAVDLFSCAVTSYELTIDYEEKIMKENVTLICPYGVTGLVSTCPPPRRIDITPAVWAHMAESASNYVIMSGTTDKTPAILMKVVLTIEVEIDLFPDIGVNYRKHLVSGLRTVTMNLTGKIQTNDLWTVWATDIWNDAAGYYTTNAAKLNSVIKVEQVADHHTWAIAIDNWLIEADDMRLFSISDKILGIDIIFTGATPDASGYIIDSLVITDYIPKIYYDESNAES